MKAKDYLFPLLTLCLVTILLVLIAKIKPKSESITSAMNAQLEKIVPVI